MKCAPLKLQDFKGKKNVWC